MKMKNISKIKKEIIKSNFENVVNIGALIYKSVIYEWDYKKFHRELKKETYSWSKYQNTLMIDTAKKQYKKVSRLVKVMHDEDDTILLPILALMAMRKNKSYEELKRTVYIFANKVEENLKKEEIKNALTNNSIPFFLVSYHKDSAKDHEEYQGKLYYDENYKDYLTSSEISLVESIIRDHNMQSFQWVIDSPVYMITRINCRHYFKKIPIDRVLKYKGNEKVLIKKEKMYHDEGLRTDIQTKNVEKYQDRLKFHLKLKEVQDSDMLERMIDKDKLLIKVWKIK